MRFCTIKPKVEHAALGCRATTRSEQWSGFQCRRPSVVSLAEEKFYASGADTVVQSVREEVLAGIGAQFEHGGQIVHPATKTEVTRERFSEVSWVRWSEQGRL